MKKVLGFCGSPRKEGNTERLVARILAGATEADADTALHRLGAIELGGCQACMHCRQKPECVLKDDMSLLIPEILEADAVVLGSPVYMWQVTAQTKLFMDRLYPVINPDFSTRLLKRPKMVLAFTQGHPDQTFFETYFKHTKAVLEFLGFTITDILVAAGTRAPDDIETQSTVLEQAEAAGRALCR